ncbi:hypothetical protein SAMN02745248_00249 [Hathewaya proteolytica DSM 3090]|uniref:Cof subfamily of IIB subfamily of haloacid dehalogenase superfamily/HAD-superfamily hydrolase, subfamily IIB n=1 Tax=Hathewaya proteolytica DSM 3090 TaxID=1121331 RepID=A0A1M6JN05_9CLOT|nr:HAD family hydrolase [Hathewaya proteolytica]SHJ47994.1 hypothetical protein SAMN02745248_00249 [Hathewaya proteolytica DSM 3090]
MIKAIFFDLDGTLLDDNKRIQKSSIEALQQCREKGIKLYISTGRSPLLKKMLSLSAEEERLFNGGVFCNGACVMVDGVREYTCISEGTVLEIIEATKMYPGLNIALQMENEIHGFRYPLAQYAYGKWGIDEEETLNLKQSNKNSVVKILIFYENIIDSVTEIEEAFIERVQSLCKNIAVMYITDGGKVLQIMYKDINKKEGIEKIRKINGFKEEEVAVFGDDVNDMEMLSFYKNSVAMGNAPEGIKKIAGMVTKSNNDNGIAYAVEHLLHV